MNRSEKLELVTHLKEKLTNSDFVSLIHYRGMSDKEIYDLRVSLKEKDCGMKVAKNTLIKLAIKDTDLSKLDEYINGPTAILYSDDPVALSKSISDAAKTSKNLKFVTGFFNNDLVTEQAMNSMAKLGSLDDVRASFIAKLNGVQSSFVRILAAPEQGLASNKN